MYDRAKGLTWLGLGVEASRKFYFGILNFPVPESIEPAHMWIVDPRAGAGLRKFYFSILNFLGTFLLVLRVWLEAWAAWAGRVVVQEI